MTRQRYPETFKIEAVKQVTERGRPVADVARALGVSSHSLYAWCIFRPIRACKSNCVTAHE